MKVGGACQPNLLQLEGMQQEGQKLHRGWGGANRSWPGGRGMGRSSLQATW